MPNKNYKINLYRQIRYKQINSNCMYRYRPQQPNLNKLESKIPWDSTNKI